MKKIILSLICLFFVSTADSKELYIFNWTEYMPDDVISAFEKEYKINVIYSTFESNEAMYAKVKMLRGTGYDIIFPSTYYISRMRLEGLISKIDKSEITNFNNIDKNFLNLSFDPENNYSVPYLWGSTGIGINSKYIKEGEINSWADLWDKKYKGKVLLTNDLREFFAIGLMVLGYSGNDKNEEHIKLAYEKLKGLIPSIKIFSSDSPKQPFLNEDVYIGVIWNGEMYTASKINPDLKYIYPKEGSILWMDSMVIPSGSKNKEDAYKFIDFILRPEVGKLISEKIGYSSPNKESLKLIDNKTRSNAMIYPPDTIIKKSEFQLDVGEAILVYEKYWQRLKTGY